MAKTFTHYDRTGLSDSEKTNNKKNASFKPSEKALRFCVRLCQIIHFHKDESSRWYYFFKELISCRGSFYC